MELRLGLRHLAGAGVMAAAALVGAVGGAAAAANDPPIIVSRNAAEAPQAAAALFDRANERGQLRVIIETDVALAAEATLAPTAVRAQRERLRASQRGVLASLAGGGVSGVVLFDTIPYLAVNADSQALRRLLADPAVVSVQEDVPVPPTLAQSVPLIKADQAVASGFSGSGQVVAILDTGVAKTHPMLAGKVVSEACYSTTVPGQSTTLCPGGGSASTAAGSGVNCALSIDGCYHGTHVASIAAGNAATLKGVARGANVIAIQVFSRFTGYYWCGYAGSCVLSYTSDQIRALERVFALRGVFKIAAANMSLGGGAYASACNSDSRVSIIGSLKTAKIATVIAAGNNGFNGQVSAPGCVGNAITVGSTTKTDTISSFSNHASLVDVLAPGSSIYAAYPATAYATLSGTSMAAPHVAGAFAILKQAKPAATVAEIETALECTGRALSRAGVSKPRINVKAALDVIRSPATGCR